MIKRGQRWIEVAEEKKSHIIFGRLDIPFEVKDVAKFPGYAAVFGPGIIWAGLSQGSGELIWWPYLVSKYGLWFMAWMPIWAILQWWYNQELGRYTLATGESVYDGFMRIHFIWGWVCFAFAVIMFSWVGGYQGAAASAMTAITKFPPGWDTKSQVRFWMVLLNIITWLIVMLGPVAYRVVEVIETLAAVASFFGMLAAVLATPEVLAVGGKYFASYLSLKVNPAIPILPKVPPNWDVADTAVLITSITYTGAGGIWNTGYSFWVRDGNWGQAAHVGRVTSPLTGKPEAIPSVGVAFEATPENIAEWKKWVRTLWLDNLFGVLFNMFTIVWTAWLSYGILHPAGLTPKGWQLVTVQGEWFAKAFGEPGRIVMLLLGFFFLFDIQFTAGDLMSRIVSDYAYVGLKGRVKSIPKTVILMYIWLAIFILPLSIGVPTTFALYVVYLFVVSLLMAYSAIHDWEYRKIYYSFFTLFIIVGCIQIFLKSPATLILSTGVLNMAIQAIFCTALLVLNWYVLPKMHPAGKEVRPSWITFILLLFSTIIWWYCTAWYIQVKFG